MNQVPIRSTSASRYPGAFIAVLLSALLSRMLAMWLFPLTDATEARYGEIARLMVETDDWITPQYDYGVPFWAKPPLSTWLSAGSMELFGVNEFALRLPSLLMAAAVLAIIWKLSAKYISRVGQLAAMIVLATMTLFYVVSGTVMTDETLLFTCTIILTSFWLMVKEQSRVWGYMMFFGLGLGFLAKGPVAWALTGIPAFVWLCWAKRWDRVFQPMPIIGGTMLMLLVGVPWYIIAEMKTPGFLHYFFVGENFDRFIQPGWNGDRYGHAHAQPLGSIWLFVLASGMPWLAALAYCGARWWRETGKIPIPVFDDMTKFLLCWFLIPNLFFTFSSNILITYPLVSLPALALLIVKAMEPVIAKDGEVCGWVYATGAVVPVLVLCGLSLLHFHSPSFLKTASVVSRDFHAIEGSAEHELLYIGPRIYSLEYYNNGKVRRFDTAEQAIEYGKTAHQPYLMMNLEQKNGVSEKTLDQLELLTRSPPKFLLYKITAAGKS